MLRVLRHLRLRTILGLALAILAIVAFGLLTIIIGWQAADRVEADIGESLGGLALSFRTDLEREIAARRDNVVVLTHSLDWDPANRQSQRNSLRLLQGAVPGFNWIAALDPAGRVTVSTAPSQEGQAASSQPWPTDTNAAARVRRRSPVLSYGNAASLLDIAAPIADRNGVAVGVLGARLDRGFAEQLRRDLIDVASDSHPQIQVLLLDQDGTVIVGSPAELGHNHASWFAANSDQSGDGYGTYNWDDGVVRVIGSASATTGLFADLGWSILVMEPLEVAYRPARALQWRIAYISALATLMFILAGLVLATITTRPLRRISSEADAIGVGDQPLMDGIHVPAAASAEIVALAASLQGMLHRLQRNQQRLHDANRDLDRKVAERTAEALAARDEAVAATRSKSRFLAAASHDLRQPLQALSLLMGALGKRLPDGEAKRIGEQAAATVTSLRGMFDSLLDVSKLDADVVEPQFVAVDIAPRVSALSSEYRLLADKAGLTLRVSVASQRPVLTDPGLLEAVLRNLIGNALKFTVRGGILITSRARADGLLVQVHDTGPGIAVERQTSVFEAFERSGEAARGDNDGLGLGLSIVSRLATALNARLVFRSRLGRGTRIGLLLPYAQGAASVATRLHTARTPASPPERALHDRIIVLLEDDPVIREALARELTEAGAKVHAHGEIAPALATLKAGRVDLAVVDYHLRNRATGADFVHAIAAAGLARPRLIFVTGATDTATLGRLSAFGVPILTKPLDYRTLERAIAERLTPSDAE